MKYRLAFISFLSLFLFNKSGSAQYASQGISLLSKWDTVVTIAEPIYRIRYNSVWGWVNPTDSIEYAILGSSDGTYFLNLSNPVNPVLSDYVKGRRDSCIWREYKTYQNYLYTVSDDQVNSYNQNSLQIIDLSYLPDSVHVVYDTDTLFARAHTLYIEGDKMYCGYVHSTTVAFSMAVYSLTNPVAPKYLRDLNSDYPSIGTVHDMFVKNDTVYASCGYDGLHIYKFNSNNKFTEIGSLTNYANFGQGYNHSSYLTADRKTLIFADEVPVNLAVKSLDVSNFGNIAIVDTFRSTPTTIATPHNVYIPEGSNSRVVVAYYQDGVQVFDISNPSNVTRTGFFDTAPLNCPTCPNPNYSGCWGAYIDLPSGIMLASDMQNGLFVLKSTGALGVNESIINSPVTIEIFPNPSTTDFNVSISLKTPENILMTLTDMNGKIILNNNYSFQKGNSIIIISSLNLSTGIYSLTAKGENFSFTKKLIKPNK